MSRLWTNSTGVSMTQLVIEPIVADARAEHHAWFLNPEGPYCFDCTSANDIAAEPIPYPCPTLKALDKS